MDPKIIIALDYADQEQALRLIQTLSPEQCRLKIGKHMFTRFGPAWVETCQQLGFDVFLDLKFHDIPNTVADACRAAADLGVWMLNIHASGGERMMASAHEALASYQQRPKLIAVTVLTSLAANDLSVMGITRPLPELAVELAKLAQQAGCDGVVCSAREAGMIKQATTADFLCVTPGIRLADSQDDQVRVMTPSQAIAQGADYLVVGRPITQSINPSASLAEIAADIA